MVFLEALETAFIGAPEAAALPPCDLDKLAPEVGEPEDIVPALLRFAFEPFIVKPFFYSIINSLGGSFNSFLGSFINFAYLLVSPHGVDTHIRQLVVELMPDQAISA